MDSMKDDSNIVSSNFTQTIKPGYSSTANLTNNSLTKSCCSNFS
jgi:hypothetical protein